MRSSCIKSHDGERIIVIRDWQINLCEGNNCAAALVEFFCNQYDGQVIRIDQIKEKLLNVFGIRKLSESINYLVSKKILFARSVSDPNDRWAKMDKSRYFVLNHNSFDNQGNGISIPKYIANKKTDGFVYIAKNKGLNGLLKIGKTTKDVESRLKQLSRSTSSPFCFELVESFYSKQVSIDELDIHIALSDHRVNPGKEFFAIDEGQAINTCWSVISRSVL